MVKTVKFGQNCEIWSKLWNLVKIIKIGPNSKGGHRAARAAKNVNMQEGEKSKKREGGVFHRQRGCQKIRFGECFDICFVNIYEKHPLIGKNCIQSLKKRFCKYLSSFLDAAGWSNIWFISSLSFSMSCIGF